MAKLKLPGFRQLAPEEAGLRFMEDPASILIPINEFYKYTKMSQRDFLRELQSGRLRTHVGPPDKRGQRVVFVKGDDAVTWMAARAVALKTH